MASVARRLGVAPSTLRTWDRRYGLGPSRHTGGRHRRYGPDDVSRLELMQRALLRGASTAEAARYALAHLPKGATVPTVPRAAAADPPSRDSAEHTRRPTGHAELRGGVPELSRLARRLSAAALAMDAPAVQRLLASALAAHGVLDVWEAVLGPVLDALGGGTGVGRAGGAEVRHLLAECALAALVRAAPVPGVPRNRRPILLARPPEETTGLPVYALAAALAERDLATQAFGAPLPGEVLAVTGRRCVPAAVVLWAHRRSAADPRLFHRLARGRQRGRLFACGPGWSAAELPPQVELLGDLRHAAGRLEHVVAGGRPQ
ncbi:MerR-like DNA binding protein [Prauserella shujinwangii]|uniref:MerR-like DNA binding protein n=1 Tax=Prauserella shujinwangii TaxID=1453103 RepID=A0A2T0LLV2_9PSEU|nr:MerR family transcriptional regulator [Prauserella shujinwangii]PRX44013.1 MerR-like DNA binding protein [Prauserella shujinwangii]